MPYEIPDSDSNPIWVPDRSQATYYVFSFAFDDVGLENGLTVYTPSVGDGTVFLLDAALLIDEAFDGTTPFLDMGTGVGAITGLWKASAGGDGQRLADVDDEGAGAGIQVGTSGGNGGYGMILAPQASGSGAGRFGYAPFTALNPLKLWVSQDGTLGGTAVGGTAGAGRLVFSIVTPEAAPG